MDPIEIIKKVIFEKGLKKKYAAKEINLTAQQFSNLLSYRRSLNTPIIIAEIKMNLQKYGTGEQEGDGMNRAERRKRIKEYAKYKESEKCPLCKHKSLKNINTLLHWTMQRVRYVSRLTEWYLN